MIVPSLQQQVAYASSAWDHISLLSDCTQPASATSKNASMAGIRMVCFLTVDSLHCFGKLCSVRWLSVTAIEQWTNGWCDAQLATDSMRNY